MIWDIPYSFGPDSFVELGVHAHVWGLHLLHGKFSDLLECLRGKLLEIHAVDALVDVDGVLPGQHLVEGEAAFLLTTILCGSHRARQIGKNVGYCLEVIFLIQAIDWYYLNK